MVTYELKLIFYPIEFRYSRKLAIGNGFLRKVVTERDNWSARRIGFREKFFFHVSPVNRGIKRFTGHINFREKVENRIL